MGLVDMERSYVDALSFNYKHEREMAKGTLRNYRKALKKFFRYDDCDWAEDIEIGSIPDREPVDKSRDARGGAPRVRTQTGLIGLERK
jgi:hypothetical protein